MSDHATSHASRETGDSGSQFGSYYYSHDCGIPYERNEHWMTFFDRIAESIVREFHPSSVMDAGCAMGFLVESLRKRGVEASEVQVFPWGSFTFFADPDGNRWAVQQLPPRQ